MSAYLYERARQTWIKNWPNFCATCEGWGGMSYQFVENGEVCRYIDLCPDCKQRCSRCGGHRPTESKIKEPCPHCNHNFDDGMPCIEESPADE